MRLQNERLQRIIEKIIKSALQKGILLNSKEFQESLNKEINEKDLSNPQMFLKNTRYGYTLSDYNKTKESIEDDFVVFFNTIIILYDQLQKNIDKYNSLKKSKEKEIKQLKEELEKLIFENSPNAYISRFIETFKNVNNVSDDSTALINTINHEVSLNKGIINKKINLTKENVYLDIDENEYDWNYYNSDSPYKCTIYKNEQVGATCNIVIDLKEPTRVSSLSLQFSFIKNCSISIELDDSLFFSEDVATNKTIEINSSIRKINIILSKKEADKYNGEKYQYIFCVDNIGIYNNIYSSAEDFISTPIILPTNTTSFKFFAEDFIPNNTQIKYYYKIGDRKNWEPLQEKTSQLINLYSRNDYEKYCSPNEEYIEDIKRNKMSILTNLGKINVSNLMVFKGCNMATKETFFLTDNRTELNSNDVPYEKCLEKCSVPFGIFSGKIDIENGITDDIVYAIKYTSYIYSSNYEAKNFSINNKVGTYKIFINGQDCTDKYVIKNGWNKIEIIIYLKKTMVTNTDDTPSNEINYSLEIQMPQSISLVLADNTPMEKCDYQTLRFSDEDLSNKYCVKNNGDQEILVLCDKKDVDYYVKYFSIGGDNTSILIKAELMTSDTKLTPKLYSYQLFFE